MTRRVFSHLHLNKDTTCVNAKLVHKAATCPRKALIMAPLLTFYGFFLIVNEGKLFVSRYITHTERVLFDLKTLHVRKNIKTENFFNKKIFTKS